MEHLKTPLEKGLERKTFYNKVILALLVILFLWIGYLYYEDRQNPRIRDISLSDPVITGPTALCPGETLLTSYDSEIKGEGVVIRDMSIQQSSPANIILFSEMLRAPVIGPIKENIQIPWTVPETYFDYRTGIFTDMGAGEYFQIIAISSTGRYALSEVKSVQFTVKSKDEC